MLDPPTRQMIGHDHLTTSHGRVRPRRVDFRLGNWSLVSSDRVPRWALCATLTIIATSVVVSLTAAWTRGPWVDEFWSLWLTNTDIPWRAALQERWLPDVHPPLFSAVSRLVSGVFGDDLRLRRMQNLVPLVALLAFFTYVDRFWHRSRQFVVVFAVLCFGSYFATGYFAEYRSYFTQFCLGIVFYTCGYALLCRDHVVDAAQRRIALGLIAASGLTIVNLHFVSALVILISLGAMALILLAQREYRLCLGLVAIAAVSAALLVVDFAFQGPYLLANSGGQFWIDTSWGEALQVIASSVAKGVGLNVIACLAAGFGLLRARGCSAASLTNEGLLGWIAKRDRRSEEIVVSIAFLIASLIALTVLFVVNFQTPIILDRYLVLCSVAIGCSVTILAKDGVFARPAAFALVLMNSALFIAISADKIIFEPRWNASAAMIAGLPMRCSGTPVEAFIFPYRNTLGNEQKVLEFAYRLLSIRYGFPVHITGTERRERLFRAGNCPTILWTENVPWSTLSSDNPDAAVLAAARATYGVSEITSADVKRTKTGAVIILNDSPRS
jgi:hypothetical protein